MSDKVLPGPEAQNRYLGPQYTPRSRDTYFTHRLNRTPSLADPYFGDTVDANDPDVATLTDEVGRLSMYRGDIREHSDGRVHGALIDYALVHNTGFDVSLGKVTHQGEISKALKIKDHRSPLMRRQSAHHFTNGAWTVEMGGRRHSLYEGSHVHAIANATASLPIDVNKGDSLIDGRATTGKLRTKHEKMVKQAAAGTLTPWQAIPEFLTHTRDEIVAGQQKPNAARRKALEFAEEDLDEIEEALKSPEVVDRMLSTRCDDPQLRPVVRKMAVDLIQKTASGESKAVMRVIALQASVKAAFKRKQKVEEAFLYALVEEMGAEGVFVKKLFALPPEPTTPYKHTAAIRAQFAVEFGSLTTWLKAHRCQLESDRRSERGSALRTLRVGKQLSQAELGAKIQGAHLAVPSSRTSISNMETGKRSVHTPEARRLSELFKIDSNILTRNEAWHGTG